LSIREDKLIVGRAVPIAKFWSASDVDRSHRQRAATTATAITLLSVNSRVRSLLVQRQGQGDIPSAGLTIPTKARGASAAGPNRIGGVECLGG
jgi:hypothetical protein